MRRFLFVLVMAGLLLCCAFFAGCASTPPTNGTAAPTASTTAATTGSGTGQPVTVALAAQNMRFDRDIIVAPAGATVTIAFDNRDAGVQHNVAVYTDASAGTTIFRGQVVTGPGTTTYTFAAPSTPGTYFFRCDVHPESMTGQFVVQ